MSSRVRVTAWFPKRITSFEELPQNQKCDREFGPYQPKIPQHFSQKKWIEKSLKLKFACWGLWKMVASLRNRILFCAQLRKYWFSAQHGFNFKLMTREVKKIMPSSKGHLSSFYWRRDWKFEYCGLEMQRRKFVKEFKQRWQFIVCKHELHELWPLIFCLLPCLCWFHMYMPALHNI